MMIRPEDAYVLVIEDDANNLMITVDLLRMMGIRYVNARASGRQVLKLIETITRVDLVLLDIQLPYEDGYQVLRQLRAQPKLRTTRIAAVTANVLTQDEARARAAGFDGFIGKPIDFDRFPQQIRLLLEGAEVWQPR
jgi:FOG: CheY-like receiver